MILDESYTDAVEVLAKTETELLRAVESHGIPVDYHHGYGVLLEELDELWEEIKRKETYQNPYLIRSEAIQVAAMACKIAMLASKVARDLVSQKRGES